ncbi:GNAT family N-acetyltransferase [Pontiellaceae bacterium B12227]|nr:GNAT family N-acetyltransferase [Pontiellaceae bacterium B12227]
MKKEITIEKIMFGPELIELKEAWDTLLENSSRPTIFSSFDFIYTSCAHFKEDEEIFFLLFRDAVSNELMAIFPMSLSVEKCYGIKLRTLAYGITTNGTDVDKPYPIIAAAHEAVCWERLRDYLCKEWTQWDMIDFDEFYTGSYLTQHLKKMFPQPVYWTKLSEGPESPIVKLDGDWEEFWMGHRKLRKNSRKLEKKMGDNLVYKITSDPADVEQCLNDYIATELVSWKAGEFVSNPDSQKFYHDLFPKMAAEKRLFFGMMYDREKVMSVEIAYAFKDRIFFAHGTYDPAYKDVSPGTVNSSRLIEFFHGKGYVEGDYLAGFSGYNNPWASRIEKTADIVIRRMNWKNCYLAIRYLAKKGAGKLFGRKVIQDEAQ